MNKRAAPTYLLYLIAIPIIAAVAVALRTAALLGGYEAAIGRYTNQTLSLINGLFLLAAVGALALLTHEMREYFVSRPNYRDLPTLFSGIFAAIALVLFGVTLPLDAIHDNRYAITLAIFSGIMALAAAALFILRSFNGTAKGGIFAILNLPITLLGVFYPFYLSFRNGTRIGDPAVSMACVAWVLIAFFFLGESRIALGRAMWGLHAYITALTVITSAALALPNLVYHLATGEALLRNSEQDFAVLAIFLYALARLFAVSHAATHEGSAATRFAMGEGEFVSAASDDGESTDTEENA